jgi:hypothetical protein
MNHRHDTPNSASVYRDHANVSERGDLKEKEENFPVRLHYVLSETEKDGLQHIVSWHPHGRCFVVHNRKLFAKKILPL